MVTSARHVKSWPVVGLPMIFVVLEGIAGCNSGRGPVDSWLEYVAEKPEMSSRPTVIRLEPHPTAGKTTMGDLLVGIPNGWEITKLADAPMHGYLLYASVQDGSERRKLMLLYRQTGSEIKPPDPGLVTKVRWFYSDPTEFLAPYATDLDFQEHVYNVVPADAKGVSGERLRRVYVLLTVKSKSRLPVVRTDAAAVAAFVWEEPILCDPTGLVYDKKGRLRGLMRLELQDKKEYAKYTKS